MKFNLVKVAVVTAGLSISAMLGSGAVITPAQAATGSPLIIYAAEGYDQVAADAFTKATGIKTVLHDDSTGPLLAKVSAEKSNPQFGVLWVDGSTAFAALDMQGQLLPYTPKATFTAAGKSVIPADHSYVPTGLTTMAALIYNSAKVKTLPKTYTDLLNPIYKGQIGMNDPNQSGPTFPFIAGLMNQFGGKSVKAGESYLTKLKANGLVVNNTNGDTLHALETGVINMGLIQSSAAQGEVLKLAAKPVAGFTPKVIYLAKSTLLPSVIGIDKGASALVQAEAKKFIDYVLSPAGQAIMQTGDTQGDSLYWPIIPGVMPLAGAGTLPTSYQSIDPYFWGPLEGQVNAWFTKNIRA
ncbi:MAG: extracellular solute-binding protein [Actinomycetes bacterium]